MGRTQHYRVGNRQGSMGANAFKVCTLSTSIDKTNPIVPIGPTMTSQANRRAALKSAGPTTLEGKERSRCNAVRRDLTAETVIAVLESSEDYEAFEATVISDYNAETTVEWQLMLRLMTAV